LGFFAFLPIIGTAICLVLGVMRANVSIVCITVFLGKLFRYVIVALSVLAFV
jgi:membrane protein YqaA with SNARE-associated domain